MKLLLPPLVHTKMTVAATLLSLILASCASPGTSTLVCPEYPNPTLEVVQALQSLKSPQVDRWVVQQMKLAQSLELCK